MYGVMGITGSRQVIYKHVCHVYYLYYMLHVRVVHSTIKIAVVDVGSYW